MLASKLWCYNWGGLYMWILENPIVFTIVLVDVYPDIPLMSTWSTAAQNIGLNINLDI